MSIKPWNEKKLFAEPEIWDASVDLDAAIKTGECKSKTKKKAKRLYQTESEKVYKTFPAHIKPIWIEGERCAGKPTRHFAWYALPKLARSGLTSGKKVPAIVLVHGGGGTAFLRWVEIWNRRGYAAIAVDTCGNLPVASEYGKWSDHEYCPSWIWGDFENVDKPIREQWCYHAVSAVVRAHSFLRSLPEIDNRKIGITGVSWGGYLTSIVSSIDSRFKFAAPIYGCGFLDLDSPWCENFKKIGMKNAKRWLKLWDPKQYLPISKVPMLWATGSNDHAYNMEMLERSASICGAETLLAVHLRYNHSHVDGWKLKEPYVFADSFCKGATKLTSPRVGRKGDTISVKADKVEKAILCYTLGEGKWPDREWKQIKMKLNLDAKFTAELPGGAKGCFVNVIDANKNQTSSLLQYS